MAPNLNQYVVELFFYSLPQKKLESSQPGSTDHLQLVSQQSQNQQPLILDYQGHLIAGKYYPDACLHGRNYV